MKTFFNFGSLSRIDAHSCADSRQQTADSRQQTADSRQQTADSRHNTLTNNFVKDSFMLSTSYLKVYILVMILMIPFTLSAQQLFIKNVGQWDSDILYAGNGEGYKIVIARSGIYINHQQVNKVEEKQDEFGNKRNEVLLSSDNLRLNFVNSEIEDNIMANIVSGKLSNITAEFWNVGSNSDWYWDVPCYEEIIISDIYPDISMKLYFDGRNIRYDFELNIDANPADIRIEVQGGQRVNIIDNELVIFTRIGEIRNGKIKSFINSNGKELPTELKINQSGEISFNVAKDNKLNEKITIDPLVYASYVYTAFYAEPEYGLFDFKKHNSEYWLYTFDHTMLNPNINFTDTLITIENGGGNTIFVYDDNLKTLKKIIYAQSIITKTMQFIEDNKIIINMVLSKEARVKHNIKEFIGNNANSCIVALNIAQRNIVNGILIGAYPNSIVIDSKNRIIFSIDGQTSESYYLTNNSYYSNCDSSYSKYCQYPHFAVINENMDSIIYSTLIPYSSNLIASDYIDNGLLIDSEDNIYIVGRVNDHFIDKYDNIIGKIYPKKVGLESQNIITSIHKFDKDFNFIKSSAIIFSLTAHCLINSKDELILVGNVHSSYRDYFIIHDDCITQDNEAWDFSRAGFMMIDKDLNYIRSGIMPGDAPNEFFNFNAHFFPPNGGSAVTLDNQDNIYLILGVANKYSLKYPIANEIIYKNGQTDEHSDFDLGITKISADLTKILYSTVYGGKKQDVSGFIDVEDSVVTIVGVTNSFDLFMTKNANIYYRTSEAHENMFVLKIVNTPTTVEDSPTDKPYIYPNPAYSYIELPESLMSRYSEYHVTDLLGRTILINRLQIPRIDISTLPKGSYNLTLSNGTSRVYYLFVKME